MCARGRYMWLSKNKDRVVTMLTKVLAAASDGGMSDLYFRVNSPLNAYSIFHAPSAPTVSTSPVTCASTPAPAGSPRFVRSTSSGRSAGFATPITRSCGARRRSLRPRFPSPICPVQTFYGGRGGSRGSLGSDGTPLALPFTE